MQEIFNCFLLLIDSESLKILNIQLMTNRILFDVRTKLNENCFVSKVQLNRILEKIKNHI